MHGYMGCAYSRVVGGQCYCINQRGFMGGVGPFRVYGREYTAWACTLASGVQEYIWWGAIELGGL